MSDDKTRVMPYENLNPAARAGAQNGGALASIEESRVIKAAEARVILAKRFPRNEEISRNKILKAFENPKLADAAMYSYPRGSETIEDLSIRAAETMAGYWGNLEYGIQEIDRTHGYSEMLAYCWDLEANVYHYRAFKARHWRDTRGGGYAVKDERDIYEVTFNLGARRLRSCILEALPAHIKEEAESIINETLKNAEGAKPIQQRVATMLENFLGEYKVTREMIERRLGHSLSAVSEVEMVGLRKIYKTLKDGQAKAEDFFEADGEQPARTSAKPAAQQQRIEPEKPKAQEDAGGAIDPNAHKTADEARAAVDGQALPDDDAAWKAGRDSAAQQAQQQPAAQAPAKPTAPAAGEPGMPNLTFTEAFAAIAKARTADELDVIRSQIKHLKEQQQTNLNVSITNKMRSLDARGGSKDSSMSVE